MLLMRPARSRTGHVWYESLLVPGHLHVILHHLTVPLRCDYRAYSQFDCCAAESGMPNCERFVSTLR